MKTTAVILGLLAGLLLSLPPQPVSAQTGYPSQVAKLTSLRSGNPQNVVNAITTIRHDDLAETLYRNLYHVAGSEPSSLLEASAVAKALGFVLLIGMNSDLEALSESELEQLRISLQSLLLQIQPSTGYTVDEYQWHAVQLMQYSTAYDFYRAFTGTDDLVIESLLASYTSSAVAQLEQPFVIKNNLSLKLAASAGYTALILQSSGAVTASQRNRWLTVSMDHIEKTLWEYQSDPDGVFGYSEGPWYFRYAMMNLLPFFLTFDEVAGGGSLQVGDRAFDSPLRQPRYRNLFDWIATLRMPSGMLPPFEDSYMNSFFPELATMNAIPDYGHLAWENYSSAGSPVAPTRLSSELARSYDGRVEYLLRMPGSTSNSSALPLVRHMPEAGYSVFRSSWDERALYFGIIGKHGIARTHRSPVGSGHKQANEGACILAAGGEMLLIEPGYHSSAEREALVYSDHHNILLVDGAGPDSTSYGSALFGVDAHINDTLARGNSGMSVVTTRYQEADVERRSIVLDGRFVILRDHAQSVFPRTFTQQLHGNGSRDDGSCTLNAELQSAQWISGQMTLHAVTNTTTGSPLQTLMRRRHAPSSGRFAEHDALYSSSTGSDAVFHTVLHPAGSSDQVLTDVLGSTEGTSLLRFRTGSDQLISLINNNTRAVTVDVPDFGALTTDALAFHCILDPAGRPELWMCDEGSNVQRDNVDLLSSSTPVRVLWSRGEDSAKLTVRSESAGTLRIAVASAATSISGRGFDSWHMDHDMLVITLSNGDADMTLHFDEIATGLDEATRLPSALRLENIYPQPLDAAAQQLRIPFTLTAPGPVNLAVFDLLGREIRSVDAGMYNAGAHVSTLTMDDLRPGRYFIQVRTPFASAVQHIVIH